MDLGIGEAGLRWWFGMLLGHPGFAKLRRLGLRRSTVTDQTLKELAESPQAGELRHLDLEGHPTLTGAGLAHLARSPHVTGLVSLNLSDTAVRGRDVKKFLRSPNCRSLRVLYLPNFECADAIRGAAESPHCANLTTLVVSDGLMSHSADGALDLLLKSTNSPNLTYLSVPITGQRAVEALLEADHIACPDMQPSRCVTPRARQLYRARFGDLYVGGVVQREKPMFDW